MIASPHSHCKFDDRRRVCLRIAVLLRYFRLSTGYFNLYLFIESIRIPCPTSARRFYLDEKFPISLLEDLRRSHLTRRSDYSIRTSPLPFDYIVNKSPEDIFTIHFIGVQTNRTRQRLGSHLYQAICFPSPLIFKYLHW